MNGVRKLNSVIKTVEVKDVVTAPASQPLNKHDIVFVGDRVAIVYEKIDDKEVSICVDTQSEFVTSHYDKSKLPTKIGEKIYIDKSDGKLTKESAGNKLVGYYWGLEGSQVVFSLAG